MRASFSRSSRTARLGSLLALVALSGCQTLGVPRLFGPGPADYQRRVAHQFDPYPDKDVGGDTIGTRPLDYTEPPPEVQKSRWEPAGVMRRSGTRPTQ